MQSKYTHIEHFIALSLIILVAVILGGFINPVQKVNGEVQSSSCSSMVSRVVSIGNQSSTLVVSTTTNRASLHIQQPVNATNTVHFNFNYASATVATATWMLEHVSATGTVKEITVGKNTNFPYSGPITAVSSTGSTTILVTECIY